MGRDDVDQPVHLGIAPFGGGCRHRATCWVGTPATSAYPYYLINGRIPAAPTTFNAKPGQRISIRIINTAADTTFRVALAGHTMTVTHTDGSPWSPTQVDALLIGMAERYDVVVTAADGVFPAGDPTAPTTRRVRVRAETRIRRRRHSRPPAR